MPDPVSPLVSELVAELRKLHAEITASDRHECAMMALVRRAADTLEGVAEATPNEQGSALLADMRRKYLHAKDAEAGLRAGDWVKGEPITAAILERWIPQVEALATSLQDDSAEPLACAPVETPADGYRSAFFQLGELLGMTAMPISPKEAFETVMLPRLRAALAVKASRDDHPEAKPPNERSVTLPEFIELLSEPVYIQPWMRQYIIDALSDLQSRRAGETPCSCRGWQPIDTVPNGSDEFFFWLIPKSPEEAYTDTSGNPITYEGPGMRFMGKHRAWSSLHKATHWRRLPDGPGVKTFKAKPSNLQSLLMRARGEIRMSQCTVCGRHGYNPNPDCSNCVDRLALENDLLSFPVETAAEPERYQLMDLGGGAMRMVSVKNPGWHSTYDGEWVRWDQVRGALKTSPEGK